MLERTVVKVVGQETIGKIPVLMLVALIPASLWVAAMLMIANSGGGPHSTAGIWGLLLGLPGDILGVWIGGWTASDAAFYVAAFLGIWFFWFGLFKATTALRHRLSRSR
jgi:hypothetical protein